MTRSLFLLGCAFALLITLSCGQKGELYLPQTEPVQDAGSEQQD
jgi:predicted small lipoprotein YifL